MTLRWRHNGRDSVSNHQPHDCLLSRLFRRRSKKTSKLRDTGLCVGNSPGTGEFPAQMASYAENVSIWWRHHEKYFRNLTTWHKCYFHCSVSTTFVFNLSVPLCSVSYSACGLLHASMIIKSFETNYLNAHHIVLQSINFIIMSLN